jgi:hypothetical protein
MDHYMTKNSIISTYVRRVTDTSVANFDFWKITPDTYVQGMPYI